MLKKVITIILLLCLVFSISIMAVTAAGEMQQGGGRGGMPPMGETAAGDFTHPEGFTPPDGEFAPPQMNESNSAETTAPRTDAGVSEENQDSSGKSEQAQDENLPFSGEMPEGMGEFSDNRQSIQNTETQQSAGFVGFVKTYSTPITSVILLALAFLFVFFYKKRSY